ncbi:MAG TPA: tetratricopeptide repeat protein [Stellaceae bacterium]|nr:tetratricopeptide repeat protein [Stellaceae bacterium]
MSGWRRAIVFVPLLATVLWTAMPGGMALAQEDARAVLLDKANYWRLKDRPDLSAEALNKLLEINPNDPDALFLYGELSVQQNKPADAQRYLQKLQRVAPNDPHVADLQAAIRAGRIGPSDLNEARRLAQSGQLDEAVKKYQEVFHGPPPSGYGVEYYMTLAGTPQGWDEARQGLEKLAQEQPSDTNVKLSLAELYTYREPTRPQGIAMLAELSKNPVVADKAKAAWKQALTWLGGSPAAKQSLQQYLARYPDDQDIQQLLADIKNQPTGSAEQSQAYVDLKKGNIAAAERQFLADLKANPNDPQALAGLGLVRLRQQRFAEARDLLGRAEKAAPEQKKDIEPAYDSAMFWSRVNEAKGLAARRNYAGARSLLAPMLAHPHADQWGALLVLADIETKSGQFAAAEQTYRQVLRFRPGNPDAVMGLANALRRQNKTAELNQLTSRMSPAERARFEKATTSGGGEAEKLRNEAKAASANGDNATATAKFQAAIAADPKDPWIRLDYARFLAGQGNLPQAFAAVNPQASGNSPTSMLVASMFDAQQDRWIEALDRIEAIPPAQRTQDINAFRDRIYVRGNLERAKRMASQGDVAGAKALLIKLYNDPSVTTDEKRQAPFVVLKDLNDQATAIQMTHDAYVRGGPGSTKAGADYVMMLLLVGGHDDEAAATMAQINASGRITDQNREDFAPINIMLAIKQADKLKDKGDYAGAWDQISQLLNDNPDSADLLLCAGRIYAASGRSKEAMEYFDKAYQQDSGNIDVLRGVIAGAIAAHEYGQASDYLAKAMEVDPQNPWLFYLKAQIAQARGDNGEAVAALRQARTLNLQKGGPDAVVPGAPVTSTTTTSPGGSATPPPPNPFRRSQSTLPTRTSGARS